MTLQDLGFTSPVPLILITLVLGFILGWVITGLPARSKISHTESQALELNTKLTQANQTIAVSQAHERDLQANLEAADARLAQATGALKQELAARDAELATRDAELADIRLQQAATRDAAQQSYGSYHTQIQAMQVELERVCDENETLKENLEGTTRDLAKTVAELETVRQAVTNKDTALTEAYARAVRLERESTDEQSQVLSLQAEVAGLKRNVSTLVASNHELNSRLDRARGEVAAELAALTSTMIRVKDEDLAEANATISALQAQLAEHAGRPVLG